MKTISMIVLVILGLIATMIDAGHKFSHDNRFCDSDLFKSFMHIGSGCHYQTYFEDSPSANDLVIEKIKLDEFVSSGNLELHIHWYRKNFEQRFRDIFDYTFNDINVTHWRYMNLNPTDISEQMKYVNFLYSNGRTSQAQSSLSDYCAKYVPKGRGDVIHSINIDASKYDFSKSLDFVECGLKKI